MALNRSDKSRILRRYFPGMTRNSEMSTEPKDRELLQGLARGGCQWRGGQGADRGMYEVFTQGHGE